MRMGLYYSGGYDWPYNDAVLSTGGRRRAGRPRRRPLRGVRHGALARAHRPLPAVRALERHLVADATRGCPHLFARLLQHRGGGRHQRSLEGARPAPQRGDRRAWCAGPAPSCRRCGPTSPSSASTSPSPARSTPTSAPPSTTSCARPRRASGSWPAASGTPSGPTATSRPRTSSRRRSSSGCSATSWPRTAICSSAWARGPTAPSPRCSRRRCAGSARGSSVNGEAIYGSRPWVVTESATTDGTPLRFTKSGEGVYALVLGTPPVATDHHAGGRRRTGAPGAPGRGRHAARVVGRGGGDLSVTLPQQLPVAAVTVLDLGTDVRARRAPTGAREGVSCERGTIGPSRRPPSPP